MATFKVMKQQDYEALMEYLNGKSGVVLIPESVVKELSPKAQALLGKAADSLDTEVADYNFGGECDVMLDFAGYSGHFALKALRSFLMEDESDE